MIDLGMNEGLHVREADDGPFVVVWPLGSGPHWGNVYHITLGQQSNGIWHAVIPQMPHIEASASSREAVKVELASNLKRYLRDRVRYIAEAEPLVSEYIHSPAENGSAKDALIRNDHLPVWQVIDEMDDAFTASARGDDTVIIDRAQIAEAARHFGIGVEAVRAAVAYYLQHKSEIRQRIIEERRSKLDETFRQVAVESGMTEDELADLLSAPSGDVAPPPA
jgi:hypothetical protein